METTGLVEKMEKIARKTVMLNTILTKAINAGKMAKILPGTASKVILQTR